MIISSEFIKFPLMDLLFFFDKVFFKWADTFSIGFSYGLLGGKNIWLIF